MNISPITARISARKLHQDITKPPKSMFSEMPKFRNESTEIRI
jgi:hypothetical protein